MMRMHHRLSKHVDLFLHDAQWLARLTPRLNDHLAGMVRHYSEQANSVKLVLALGDIDFVVAGSVTGVAPSETLDFGGRRFPLEATEEILAKKLYFRAASLKPRDVFDLVVAHQCFPASTARAVEASRPRRDLQLARLRELARTPEGSLMRDFSPLPDFKRLVPSMISTAVDVIRGDEEARR